MQEKIKAVFQKAIANKWSYPQAFDALKEIGVRSYVTDVANYKINYVWDGGSFLESGPADFKANVGDQFKEADVIKAIRRSQRREIDFKTFLQEIAIAGVPQYRVDMSERTVSYLGHNEATDKYVERVPQLQYVLIIHEVESYSAWKVVFDNAIGIRKKAGEISYQLLRYDLDAKRIVHLSKWESIDRARSFFESPELVEIRKQAGVKAPQFIYLQEIEQGILT